MEILIIAVMVLFLVISNIGVIAYLIYQHKPVRSDAKAIIQPLAHKVKTSSKKSTPKAFDDEILYQKEMSEKKSREPFI